MDDAFSLNFKPNMNPIFSPVRASLVTAWKQFKLNLKMNTFALNFSVVL